MRKDKLEELNISELYNFILFTLYKLKDNPDYLRLCELMFLFDKDTLLTLLEYFGGTTITIPTIDDLKTVVKALTLYISVNCNNESLDNSINKFILTDIERENLLKTYDAVVESMKMYHFKK